MPALRELQTAFASAMFEPHADSLAEFILEDGMPVDTRLDVYRNNIFSSLVDVLAERFPVVCRVVDERFFRYVCDRFIHTRPPREAVLSGYGDAFADFLATFPACQGLAYLPDLARFEWLIHTAAQVTDVATPSVGLLQSDWPIDQIWRVNRNVADEVATIDLNVGGVRLMVSCVGGEVGFQRLSEAEFAFCSTLSSKRAFAEAMVARTVAQVGGAR